MDLYDLLNITLDRETGTMLFFVIFMGFLIWVMISVHSNVIRMKREGK